jgi:SanA protein
VRGKLVALTATGLLLLVVWLGVEAARISREAGRLCYSRSEDVPAVEVGLLLGCSPRLGDGSANPYFVHRVEAARVLFQSGKIKYLLVSGDNGRRDYDEPTAIRDALVEKGVPPGQITLDYAGFRTLDSVVRAREVFGVSRLIVISQRFQNERAIYLARANGIEAFGFDAVDVGGIHGVKTRAREVLARLRAVVDVRVLRTRPRYLGPRLSLEGVPAA